MKSTPTPCAGEGKFGFFSLSVYYTKKLGRCPKLLVTKYHPDPLNGLGNIPEKVLFRGAETDSRYSRVLMAALRITQQIILQGVSKKEIRYRNRPTYIGIYIRADRRKMSF